MGIFDQVIISKTVILSEAGSIVNLDTLFVVVVVLAVLLLIALIYLASIMSYLKNNQSTKTVSNGPVGNAITQIVGNGQVELAGNHELVAVITAAIYASMEGDVPTDGLVVRSIRKVK
jgi:glutaconyl-CoA/methylmalonyl-CoA decarboxylase subunit delta